MKASNPASGKSILAYASGTRNIGVGFARRAEDIGPLRLGLNLGAQDHVLTTAQLAELDRLYPARDGAVVFEMH